MKISGEVSPFQRLPKVLGLSIVLTGSILSNTSPFGGALAAEDQTSNELAELSLELLMDIQVTSVSKLV